MLGIKEIWGIDLGTSTVKAVKLVKAKGHVIVTDFDILEVEEIEGYEGEEEEYEYEKMKRTLLRLINRKHMQNSKVAVVLPGHSAIVKKIHFPTLDVNRVKKMMNFEAAQQIPFPLEEVVWDYQLLGVAESGMEYEVSLFAIKKGLVDRYLSLLNDAGLDVELLQVSPMALYNFIYFDIPPEEGENLILLDMGHNNSDLVICAGRNFLIRNIPTAGDDITKAFQRKFSVSYGEAENIKLELTDSKQSQKLFSKVVEPILHDLVGDMQRTINYFSSQYSGVEFSGIITSGAPFQMPGALQFIADRLQLGVINIDELETIVVSLRDIDYFYDNLPRMAIAVGGALQGVNEGPVEVNLLPSDIRVEKVFEKKKPIAVLGLFIIIVTLIFSYWVSSSTREYNRDKGESWDGLITASKKYEKDYQKHMNSIVPVKQDCEKMTGISGLLESVPGRGKPLSRYVITFVLDTVSSTIAEKFNDFANESESLWIDKLVIKQVPCSWEGVQSGIQQHMSGGSGNQYLGDIESYFLGAGSRDRAGSRPGLQPRSRAAAAPSPGSGESLLLCYFKGRTRKNRPHIEQMKAALDRNLHPVLFNNKSGTGKVKGHIVYVYPFTDEMQSIPVIEAAEEGETRRIEIERRRYLIFHIVWICRLQPDGAAETEVSVSAPAPVQEQPKPSPRAGMPNLPQLKERPNK